MVDDVYTGIEQQGWEIPPSNSYLSDSDSPLSFISSSPPSHHTLSSSPALTATLSSMTPSYHAGTDIDEDQEQRIQLPYPSSKDETSEKEDAEYRAVMYHEHIIACNDSICSIKPSNISIEWLTSLARNNDPSSSNTESSTSSSQRVRTSSPDSNSSGGNSVRIVITQNLNNTTVEPNSGASIASDGEQAASTGKEERQPAMTRAPARSISFKEIIFQKQDNEPTSDSESTASSEQVSSPIKRKRKHTKRTSKPNKKSNTLVTKPIETSSNKKKKRTVTSYDAQTSQYLKSVFFEVYSKQSKLTKDQRAEVKRITGLPSRNITYWFSNHKRRFQNTLKIYKQAVTESKGAVKTYDDFVQWGKDQRNQSSH